MSSFRRMLGYVRPYRVRFVLSVLATVLVAVFNMAVVVLIAPLVDIKLLNLSVPVPGFWTLPAVRSPYALVILAFALKGIFTYVSRYLMSWVGERATADLRADVGRAICEKSVAYFAERPAGGLIARVTTDPEKVLIALSDKLYDLIKEPLSILGYIGIMLYIEWPLALISLSVGPLVVWPILRAGRKLRRVSERGQQSVADLASRMHEIVRAIRVVKASSTERLEARRVAEASRAVFSANMRAEKVVALTPPLMELLAGVGIAATFFYGQARISSGALTPGQLFAFLAALLNLYQPAKRLTRVQVAFEQAIAAASRCFRVIDAPVDVQDRADAAVLGPIKGEVRFERVSFRYEQQLVLHELDFLVPAGSVVALVGHSGAGKSTVANLILRFFDPSEGRITIDGRDLRAVTLASLRQRIGLVPQDVVLFNESLRANLTYGLVDVAEERLRDAARAACADEFIANLPEGYETMVGEAGVKLSAGQRQRVAIARALLKDPPILLLDEATSALDAQNEALVVKALNNLMRGRTTLVIAHRLSTVRRADLILVLEEGRLIESGTHAQLVANQGGRYQLFAELQASGELL